MCGQRQVTACFVSRARAQLRSLWTQNVACGPGRGLHAAPTVRGPQLPCLWERPSRDPGIMSAMHTPSGFEPSHALPSAIAGDAHAFAFRGDQILALAGNDETYAIPDASPALRGRHRGQPALPRPAGQRRLRGPRPRRRSDASPRACATSACARSSSRCRIRCWRSPRALSRSSTSTARIASAAAAARPCATGRASARRSARPAASSRIRACRRR